MANPLEESFRVEVEEELETLMPDFLKNRLKDCERLEQCVSQNNWREVERIGHILKGVCGGYGFENVSALGEAIEKYSESKKGPEILLIAEKIRHYFSRVEIFYIRGTYG